MNEKYRELYVKVFALLSEHAHTQYAREVLAPMIASKSLEMNHLYQDLGLKSRTEMGKFMTQYFPVLAAKKPKDKLWKKFLYDTIGEIAPACASCDDQLTCFSCIVAEECVKTPRISTLDPVNPRGVSAIENKQTAWMSPVFFPKDASLVGML